MGSGLTISIRYNTDMLPFIFCEAKDIDSNIRFKVLQLRDRNEPEFVGITVPNRLKEIPVHLIDDYRNRIRDIHEDSDDDDDLETRRFRGRKCLKQLYTKVFQQCKNARNNLAYEDVVDEKIIPHIESTIRNAFSILLNWIQLQPTVPFFKPLRKKRYVTADTRAPINIIVNVKSGLNVPLHSKSTTVRPFVTASYQNVTLQTSTGESTEPVWNEKLILPLELTNADYLSPNSLDGSVVLRLFDEVLTKTRHGTVKASTWLGSVEIPVSAIAYGNNTRAEGLFKMQQPFHLFSYENKRTYLSVKLTLEPYVSKLTHDMDELETTELPYIKQHVLAWNERYNLEYPHRKFSALAIDKNGKTVCVTRYIKALEPPQLNPDRFNVTASQCARYVSMIPFTDKNKFYENVWLTTEHLLKLMIGSVTDHAIALTCYLMSLQLETWLVLGYGLPYGATAYVLVREYNRETQFASHFVYDVRSASKFIIMDSECPLQNIYCAINDCNLEEANMIAEEAWQELQSFSAYIQVKKYFGGKFKYLTM